MNVLPEGFARSVTRYMKKYDPNDKPFFLNEMKGYGHLELARYLINKRPDRGYSESTRNSDKNGRGCLIGKFGELLSMNPPDLKRKKKDMVEIVLNEGLNKAWEGGSYHKVPVIQGKALHHMMTGFPLGFYESVAGSEHLYSHTGQDLPGFENIPLPNKIFKKVRGPRRRQEMDISLQ
jgi:hypothetical protein